MSARPKSAVTVLPPSPPEAGYERDFAAWSVDQAARLQALAPQLAEAGLDIANIAEEIESLGRSEFRELESRLTTIVEHLLKLEFSPGAAPRGGWIETVVRTRQEAMKLLHDSPSLHGRLSHSEHWADGLKRARTSFGRHNEVEALAPLAAANPYGLPELLNEDFWPVNRHGIIDP